MAYLQLPTRTDRDNDTITVVLEGVAYDFTFVWNYRSLNWEMSIAGVIDSLAVRVGVDLLAYVPVTTKPPGRFAQDRRRVAAGWTRRDDVLVSADDRMAQAGVRHYLLPASKHASQR